MSLCESVRSRLKHWPPFFLDPAHLANQKPAKTSAAFFENPAHLDYEEPAQLSAVYFENVAHLAMLKTLHLESPEP